jgi:hypothetical protein
MRLALAVTTEAGSNQCERIIFLESWQLGKEQLANSNNNLANFVGSDINLQMVLCNWLLL